jgi:hypothetical protein
MTFFHSKIPLTFVIIHIEAQKRNPLLKGKIDIQQNVLLIRRRSKRFLLMFPKCQFSQTTTTSPSLFTPQLHMDEETI